MTNTIRILGIAGSLRGPSYNRLLLRAADQITPDGVILEQFDLSSIPLYNQDNELTLPESVEILKKRIIEADAILFATPEYNFSVPAVLKNAIDWASRPHGKNVWARKPAAIIGASVGFLGTARAQYHLRQILGALDMKVINQPEVMVGTANERFDSKGELIDPTSRDLLKRLLENLALAVKQNNK